MPNLHGGSTVVIQMFGIESSEAGSSVCLVNTHYCCSCLTNRSSFASHMNLVYGRQLTSYSATTVQDDGLSKQSTMEGYNMNNNDEDLE